MELYVHVRILQPKWMNERYTQLTPPERLVIGCYLVAGCKARIMASAVTAAAPHPSLPRSMHVTFASWLQTQMCHVDSI